MPLEPNLESAVLDQVFLIWAPFLGTLDILGRVVLCWGQGCPGYPRMLTSVPGFHPLDASTVCRHHQSLPAAKSPPPPVENGLSRGSAKSLERPSFVYLIANTLVMHFLLPYCHLPYAQTSSTMQAPSCLSFCLLFSSLNIHFAFHLPRKTLSPSGSSSCSRHPSVGQEPLSYNIEQLFLDLSAV